MTSGDLRHTARIVCASVWLALGAGCAETPPKPGQQPAAPPKQPAVAGLIVPEGWVQEYNRAGQLVASRDGYFLQLVVVTARSNLDAFPAIKKAAHPAALPSETAELQIANTKASVDEQMEVLENEPAEVAGLTGYRLLMRHFDDRGLELRRVIYGVVDDKYIYRLTFESPALFFFERDLPAFEAMVKSFQRTADFDTAVKALEAREAAAPSARWAAVRPDPPPQAPKKQ
jgi:hypothetical protein